MLLALTGLFAYFVQVGTHEALLAQAGLYQELYERQFREEPVKFEEEIVA